MAVREVTAIVKPWYRQFYLRRGTADWASDQISDQGYERGLEAVGGFVYVGTTMYGNPVHVVVRVHDDEPTDVMVSAGRVASETSMGRVISRSSTGAVTSPSRSCPCPRGGSDSL